MLVILVAPFLYGQSPQTHAAEYARRYCPKRFAIESDDKKQRADETTPNGDREHHKVRTPVSLLR